MDIRTFYKWKRKGGKRSMTWAESKLEELALKGRENWDNDDYEAYCYCEECMAEDARDAEYLGNYEVFY